MARVKCFMVNPTGQQRLSLRRYSGDFKCPGPMGYHNGHVALADFDEPVDPLLLDIKNPAYRDAFPRHCDDCSYEFQVSDNWQVFEVSIYKREDTGEIVTLRDGIPGMMYDMTWKHDYPQWCGPDGRSLCVILPNGKPWEIDSRCSNCTLPDDNIHKCWVRHGEPPNLTVDKNGETCAAGGGSILVDGYHGFLRGGYLED